MRTRECFRQATAVFVDAAAHIEARRWDDPALGVWSVRDLVGHTGRALSTVESYLDPGTVLEHPDLPDPVTYYRAAAGADPAAIADRGRQAGLALGPDPAGAVRALAERVLPLVDAAPDSAAVRTPAGTMTLDGYLPTRSFELVVHTLDLLHALGAPTPEGVAEPVAAALELAVRISAEAGRGEEVLRALTGRQALPAAFSVL